MDSDLQPPETIADFAGKCREGHDVVFGMRQDRRVDSVWRREGESWLQLKLARLAIDGVASVSTVPLRLPPASGLLVSAVAFIYMIWILAKTLLFGDIVRGYPALMMTVLFLAGDHLGRVYEERKARPLLLVREENGRPLVAATIATPLVLGLR